MNSTLAKVTTGALAAVTSVFVWASVAYATPDDAVSLATDAGTDLRDTAILVFAALIPLAVAVMLAKKALPWARRFLGI